jgi:hypothetical protein
MTPEQAEKIVNDYGAVVERLKQEGTGLLPISWLPCPKEEIKEAIKLAIGAPHADWISLRSGYRMLASFIDDDDVQLMAAVDESWLASAWAAGLIEKSPLADADAERVKALQAEVGAEYERLLKEIDDYVINVIGAAEGFSPPHPASGL